MKPSTDILLKFTQLSRATAKNIQQVKLSRKHTTEADLLSSF